MDDLAPPPADLLRDASLFLDFDGTLVAIAETPDAVEVAARVPALLERLSRAMGGAGVLVGALRDRKRVE